MYFDMRVMLYFREVSIRIIVQGWERLNQFAPSESNTNCLPFHTVYHVYIQLYGLIYKTLFTYKEDILQTLRLFQKHVTSSIFCHFTVYLGIEPREVSAPVLFPAMFRKF